MNAPKYLQKHKMFEQSDYEYLRSKGYTNREINNFWNRDAKLGKGPLTHKQAPDIIGYLTK